VIVTLGFHLQKKARFITGFVVEIMLGIYETLDPNLKLDPLRDGAHPRMREQALGQAEFEY